MTESYDAIIVGGGHYGLTIAVNLERTYGLTEGNIFHGDLILGQLFFMRPHPNWSNYRTPLSGLYLCGAGAHLGDGVTGAPERNAAQIILKDLKR